MPEVDLVINYDVPMINDYGLKIPDFPNFLHRVGRTGRFGTDGLALTLCVDETENDIMDDIQKHYGIEIEKIETLGDLKIIYDKMREKKH